MSAAGRRECANCEDEDDEINHIENAIATLAQFDTVWEAVQVLSVYPLNALSRLLRSSVRAFACNL